MASPFSVFRKNQRTMLVVIGVFCMVGFLLGGMGVIESIQPGGGGGGGEEAVVVSWDGGELTDREIDRLRMQRGLTVRYLGAIASQAIENGGTPKGFNVSVDQRGNIQSVGIDTGTSDQAIVFTRLMHDKAEAMGFTVSDTDVSRFLAQLTDESISASEMARILDRVAGDRMTDQSLYESLRYELLAQKLNRLGGLSGVAFNTPGETWQQFNRLNRRIEAELIEINVEDFVDQVPEPTTAQLESFFEEHKHREGNPASPEPGFRQRRKLAFGYFQATLNDFLEGPDGELAKITDEEIKEYYEKNKDTSFRKPQLPELEPEDDSSGSDDSSENTPPETPAPEASDGDNGTEGDTTPEPEAPAPEEADPAATQNPEPADDPTPEPAAPATDDSDSEEPADNESSLRDATPGGALFIAYNQLAQDDADALLNQPDGGEDEEPASEDAPAEEPAAEDDNPAEPTNADGDTPAEPSSEEPAAADPVGDEPAGDKPAAEEPAAEEPATTETPTEEPAADTPKPDTPEAPAVDPNAAQPPADPGIAPEPDTAEAPATEEKVEYIPLEEEADNIRRTLALPKANERMRKALEEAQKRLEEYAIIALDVETLTQYQETNPDDEQNNKELAARKKQLEEERPDYEAIAKELGLTYGEIPLSDRFEVGDYPLGQISTFDRQTFQQIPFAAIAFGTENVTPYAPKTIGMQFRNDEQFIYWVTDEAEPRVPEFADVYDAETKTGPVVDAWKLQQALPLAKAYAEKLAEESNGTDQLLEEQFKGNEDVTVLKTNPFSWLTSGGMFSMGGLQLSPVAGADMAGSEFMEAAFSLDPGEAGVAANQPHRKVYVIHVVDQSPSAEALRTQFAMSQFGGDRMQQFMLRQVTVGDQQTAYQAWLEDVEKEMHVEWVR